MDTPHPLTDKNHFDIIVAGAGTAGVASAISAARSGLQTLLIARRPVLGGNSGDLLVHSMSGFYRTSPDALPRPANGGFAMEFARRLLEAGGGCGPLRVGRQDILLRRPSDFSDLCADLCRREKNLTVLLDSDIDDVIASGDRVEAIQVADHDRAVRGSVFIDATRDAELAFLAGAEMAGDAPPRCGRTAFIFEIGEVPFEFADRRGRETLSAKIVEGIHSGLLNPQLAFAVMHIANLPHPIPIPINFDSEGDHYSALNPESLIRIQILGGNLAIELESYLRQSLEGFAKCRVRVVPAMPPPRVSRRVAGRYCLTVSDITNGVRFSDAVCCSAWPLGPADSGTTSDIPLRSLISKDFSNLLMAGRCISTEYGVQGTLRVVGTCFATGQASGLAACAMVRSESLSIPAGHEDSVASSIHAEVLKEF